MLDRSYPGHWSNVDPQKRHFLSADARSYETNRTNPVHFHSGLQSKELTGERRGQEVEAEWMSESTEACDVTDAIFSTVSQWTSFLKFRT